MSEIRNKAGKLVAVFHEDSNEIVIICHGNETRIYFDRDGELTVRNK